MLKVALTPPVHLLWRPHVEGVEHIPASGPAILCANHLSVLDPVVVGIVAPRTVFYLGKREVFSWRWRWLFQNIGVVPVEREGGVAAESSLERGRQVLESGALLGIYPEGTRSPDGRLYRGKTGAVRLAARTGAPIVPVGVTGTRKVMPPHARLPRSGAVTVRFGRPLDFRHLAEHDGDRHALRGATDSVMSEIAMLTGQAYADVYAAQARVMQRAQRSWHDLERLRPDDDSLTLDEPRSA